MLPVEYDEDDEEVPTFNVRPPDFKSRIRELRHVKASTLVVNKQNWRDHSERQRDAFRSVIGKIGFSGAILVREAEGKLIILDGHLRAEEAGDANVPVLVTDLNEEEARLLLATFDTIGAMADTNASALSELIAQLETTPFAFTNEDYAIQQEFADMLNIPQPSFAVDGTEINVMLLEKDGATSAQGPAQDTLEKRECPKCGHVY